MKKTLSKSWIHVSILHTIFFMILIEKIFSLASPNASTSSSSLLSSTPIIGLLR